ncbi:N-6 DNA methylase [Streptomyces sp. NPDC006984]|uniref:N-6 DNA methylase n=1 Tax=Streptomyces sp. NPDC006984 TaxID=3155463 RepID=UPI003404FECA
MSDTKPRGHSARTGRPSPSDQALEQVSQQLTQLSRFMHSAEAARLVLGLLYLSRIPRDAARPGVPTWAWLVNRATENPSEVRRAVIECLAHWLPPIEDPDAGAMRLVPELPASSTRHLPALIQAIGSAEQVSPLLDKCLRDLSAAQADGSNYFTPGDLARLMVGAAVPQDGNSVLDPVCGSGGLLVESHRYVHERVGLNPTMFLQGKEQHAPSSQVAHMNLAVRGIRGRIFPPGNSLAQPEPERHDIVLANLPFNQSAWAPEGDAEPGDGRPLRSVTAADPRWPEEPPPRGSANAAWIQHIAHALTPAGRAVFLMADSMATSRQSAPRRLRERLLHSDLVECVIALPPRVFGPSKATACLWVLNKDKRARPGWGSSDRRGQVLFINARRAYERVPDSRSRRLGEENTARILTTLAAWRGLSESGAAAMPYSNVPGWSQSCSTKEITSHEYSLMPTSYAVEPPSPERDTRSHIERLKFELTDHLAHMHDLELRLRDALEEI